MLNPFDDEIKIIQIRGHWEAYINDKFFCAADTYSEAVKEVEKLEESYEQE